MTRYYVYCMKWKIAGAILSMFLLIVSSKFVHAQHIEPRNPENAFIPLQLTEGTLNAVQNERLTVLQPTDLAKQPVWSCPSILDILILEKKEDLYATNTIILFEIISLIHHLISS